MNEIIYNNFNINIIENPFKHSLYKFFEEDLCNKLINNIKEIKHLLITDNKLSNSRFKINLFGDTKNGFENIDFINKIKNIEPLYSIIKEYEQNISRKLYQKYNNDNKNIISFCLMIVYDTQNYEIGPHTDSPNRNSTMVTYLGPKTNNNLGLIIYKDKINRHANIWKKCHYSFDNFKPIKQVDYFPGSTVDFKVSNISFHGVPLIKESIDRYSLQFFVKN
jgi:hypothetical protein